MSSGSDNLLEVRDLRVGFDTDDGHVTAVDGINFSIRRGTVTGIVGESGCGKTVTSMSIMRLLPQPSGSISGGNILFEGKDLVSASEAEMWALRGKRIGMIFQEPMTSLNPVHKVGRQVAEVFRIHEGLSKEDALARAVEVLRMVLIPSPEIRAGEYPHQLSGGMRQRVGIAMAMALRPSLLIADEPTTALDVTVQAQILDLMRDLQKSMGMSVLLITHDLGVIAEMCEEVVVMYAGRIVERASALELFARPRHAYTRGLLASIPRLDSTPGTHLPVIEGMVPSLDKMPPGCRFCPRNTGAPGEPLVRERPPYVEITPGHWVEHCPRCVV
ncbi:MAG TPA: ABC transporter ATP-binding protein [Verrucomicrobiales bacterium]|nr:ABC transporter ATP-binding protein [Verrucomicrobiales bacterium]